LRNARLQPDRITNIVVRLPNWLGDVVMAVPALRELRRILPHARLTLVCRPGAADVFLDADFVDDLIIYDRAGFGSTWRQMREWRRRKFDLAILFQNAFEAAAIAFLAGVPNRIGFDTDRRRVLLTHALPSPKWKDERHESFYYLHVVSELELTLFGSTSIENIQTRFELRVSDQRKRRAFDLLHEQGAKVSAPLAVLCPGSINSRAKRWPAERYAALSDRLLSSGSNVVLIGSAGEADVSQEVCNYAEHQPIVLTGKTTVAQAAAIISIAEVLITNDTGPAHLGAALGTPTLVIFGPTNPLTTFPFSPNAEIIRQPPDCAPCMLRDCPIDHRCMTAITPADVFERASVLMSRQRAEVNA
jgi:heptosyltransferase-2